MQPRSEEMKKYFLVILKGIHFSKLLTRHKKFFIHFFFKFHFFFPLLFWAKEFSSENLFFKILISFYLFFVKQNLSILSKSLDFSLKLGKKLSSINQSQSTFSLSS